MTRQSIERELNKVLRELVMKRDTQGRGMFHCFVCKAKEYTTIGTVGHFRKRRHHATKWDLMNNHFICPRCQDESKPENDINYAARIDEVYGPGTAEMLTIKSHQRSNFNIVDLSELLQNLRNQLKNA